MQLFPQVSEAVLGVVQGDGAGRLGAPMRACTGAALSADRDRKALLLDLLSCASAVAPKALGVRTNPAFAGTYEFHDEADFAALFPRFLDGCRTAAW